MADEQQAREQRHREAALRWQFEFDNAVQPLGMRAPAPVLGQTCNDYVRETMRTLKRAYLPRDHEMYKVNMRGLPAETLHPMWDMLKPAIEAEAYNPRTVPRGELREIVRRDPKSGAEVHLFVGQDCFTKQLGRPGRRVASFWAGDGYRLDASGRILR
jgi:hypothetical protein